ncbi:colicin immunity domain-containing protein [Streptomyces sp. enrichment culture]|uniref:colicin immunity domain-containing protein n=1 Tax=Streptomyces sp. enrichment culture TaxID=1795815 RepID=UPI003F56B1E3
MPTQNPQLSPAHGSQALAPYVAMAELFVSGRIDAVGFEAGFWAEFRGLRGISDRDFAVLNELFYVVEDFVADAAGRDPGDVTEVELLAGARQFLAACRGL